MKRLLGKYPFFLWLLPLFVVLHIEKENHQLIHYRFIYKEIIFLLAVPFVIFPLVWLLCRNWRKASLISLVLLAFYYFFGEIKDILKWYMPGTVWQSYTLLLPVFFVLMTACFVYIIRSKRQFARTFRFFNIVLLLFIAADLAAMIFSNNKKHRSRDTPALVHNFADSVKPDIYYLVFDSYSSSKVLKERFNFDNRKLDSLLLSKGFRIITHSKSNYNLTPFSISSQFRFNYLPDADTVTEYFMRRYLPAIHKVFYSPLLPMMDTLGYNIYNHSIFNFESYPTTVTTFDLWRTDLLYQQYNFLKKLDRDIGWQFPNLPHLISRNTLPRYAANRDHRDSMAIAHIRRTIEKQDAKPKFVYGHVLIPHSPYTFDSAGNKIPVIPLLPPEEDEQAYVEQIVYVNTIIAEIIESIFKNQQRPFIIILQGDHGYRFVFDDKNMLEFPNLSAFYFSNGNYSLLHDSLTNINTFPVIFNTFFGQQFPMQPDYQFFLRYK